VDDEVKEALLTARWDMAYKLSTRFLIVCEQFWSSFDCRKGLLEGSVT